MLKINEESSAFRIIRALEKAGEADDKFLAVTLLRQMGYHADADARELELRLSEHRKAVIADLTLASRERENAMTITNEERETLAALREGRAKAAEYRCRNSPRLAAAERLPAQPPEARAGQAAFDAVAAALNLSPAPADPLAAMVAKGDTP